ncbi:butyrophilin subfamily 3 member A1-like isoform X2 [Sardina pilchardus]|uniref:butyrophilin subfamily 3 member A1-like isoform X2 n=1 Tax=Sardina pilchardus TaxID=27697 RepID=UPI002E12DA47
MTMRFLWCLALILQPLYSVPKVVVPSDLIISIVGEDLILPCSLENSVSAVDMEVKWTINGNQLVHHYRRHMDLTDQQLPAYSGRTSLFKEELQRGNISLNLRSVRLSDTNTYRCYIRTNEGTADASFEVHIHELGNVPQISAVSHNNGSVTLVCVSTHWTIQPAIEWMDGKGNILQHAGDSVYCVGYDTPLSVQRSVTVQGQYGHSYTCRVSFGNQGKEQQFQVESFEVISGCAMLMSGTELCYSAILVTYWITKCTY